jgi:hypothetical protein
MRAGFVLYLAFWVFVNPLLARAAQRSELTSTPTNNSEYSCPAVPLPTVLGFQERPAEIVNHYVSFSENGSAWSTFEFYNLQPNEVQAVAAIMEYLDKDGHVIDSVSMIGGTKEGVTSISVPFSVERVANHWKANLDPGTGAPVMGVKHGVKTGICPIAARLTYLSTIFSNGSKRVFSSNWSLAPIPSFVPNVGKEFPASRITVPVSFQAQLAVSASGRITAVHFSDERFFYLQSWFESWIKRRWTFHPAITNGQAVPSSASILVRIHVQRSFHDMPSSEPLLVPTILIDVFPQRDGAGWEVTYGGLTEHSTIN